MRQKKQNSKNKYMISVIVPVYNVEPYLQECVDSIINQTLGFKDNIQLILVNDGSTDGSGEICLKYSKLFPDNVVYINKKNGGVSSARNAGINLATGEYISIPDSDDKLSHNAYRLAIKMFSRNTNIPLIALRQKFFGSRDGYHILDYKFTTSRIVDLDENFDFVQHSVSSTIFRREAISGVRFDETSTHGEDSKFINEILLFGGYHRYGVLKRGVYFYRKREVRSSAQDTARETKSFYSMPEKVDLYLLKLAKKKYGYIPKYIQYRALYEAQWSFNNRQKPSCLTDKEYGVYKKNVLDIVLSLDDDVIISARDMKLEHKFAIFRIKYRNSWAKNVSVKNDGSIYIKNHFLCKITDKSAWINTINIEKDKLVINGYLPLFSFENLGYKFAIYLNDKTIRNKNFEVAEKYVYLFDQIHYKSKAFNVSIPLEKLGTLKIKIERNAKSFTLPLMYSRLSRMRERRRFDYRIMNKILIIPSNYSIKIKKFTHRKVLITESFFFIQNLVRPNRLSKHSTISAIATELFRVEALIKRHFKKRQIWLFSDRIMSGGDNSEVLFRYISKQKNPKIKPYFVISKMAPSYYKLIKEGFNVVEYKSLKHLRLWLSCDLLFVSHMDNGYLFPFSPNRFSGILEHKVVHTQHGLVLNDMSGYIGKRVKDAQLFLSVCKWERNNLIKKDYGYSSNMVPVVGAPRYDPLDISKTKRIISIHPTWRSSIALPPDQSGQRDKNIKFKESPYYNFYQNLINDGGIMKSLEDNDFTLKFYIHPNHKANTSDFTSISPRVKIMKFPYDYNTIFSESAIFVTDYSNTVFDFTYLRKPVIFTQYDYADFFKQHGAIEKQVFDYEKNGFGPVCKDYKSSVSTIIKYIESGGIMDKKYLRRADNFFTYNDHKNCDRSYRASLKLAKLTRRARNSP